MKKLSLLLCLLVSMTTFAVEPAKDCAECTYEVDRLEQIHTEESPDTIAATGTLTIDQKFTASAGYEYIMVYDSTSGTGSDSTELILSVHMLDNDLNVNEVVGALDTLGATGGRIYLPLNDVYMADSYKFVLTGGAANGGQVVVNDIWIYRRRPVSVAKSWQ